MNREEYYSEYELFNDRIHLSDSTCGNYSHHYIPKDQISTIGIKFNIKWIWFYVGLLIAFYDLLAGGAIVFYSLWGAINKRLFITTTDGRDFITRLSCNRDTDSVVNWFNNIQLVTIPPPPNDQV